MVMDVDNNGNGNDLHGNGSNGNGNGNGNGLHGNETFGLYPLSTQATLVHNIGSWMRHSQDFRNTKKYWF